MPVISIIVPVYNVEAYLKNSIGTILRQSFRDFELLLIDDGSTDDSFNICEKYEAMDERVHVYHQINQGVSVARNYGLQQAKGDYVLFVDSDDYIHEQMLEQLYALAQTTEAEVVVCASKRTNSLQEDIVRNPEGEYRVFNRIAALQNLFYPDTVELGISIWNKLFRRKCLEGLSFDIKVGMNEDKYFVSQVFGRANKIVYTSKCLYFYYLRPDSVTNSSDAKRWLECVTVANRIYKDICSQYPQLELYARYQLVDACYYVFNFLLLIGIYEESDALELKQMLTNLPLKDLRKLLRLKQRLSIFLITKLPFSVYKMVIPRLWKAYEYLVM